MKALFFSFLLLLTGTAHGLAAAKAVTYYLDGAKVEYELTGKNGCMEFRLPDSFIDGTLRISPAAGAFLERVVISEVKAEPQAARKSAVIAERKKVLEDRLKSLDVREEILRSAAKSQSGRAPRKTKSNPEPMEAIRKGTDFAFSQLESLYMKRRKTEEELASLETELAALDGANGRGARVCKVWLSGAGGRALVTYLVSDRRWTPVYDFRLNGEGRVAVTLRAQFAAPGKNTSVFIAPGRLSDAHDGTRDPLAVAKPLEKIGEYTLPVADEAMTGGPVTGLAFTLMNVTDKSFPAGEASCFLRGEYLGGFFFKGAAPGDSRTMSIGVLAGQ